MGIIKTEGEWKIQEKFTWLVSRVTTVVHATNRGVQTVLWRIHVYQSFPILKRKITKLLLISTAIMFSKRITCILTNLIARHYVLESNPVIKSFTYLRLHEIYYKFMAVVLLHIFFLLFYAFECNWRNSIKTRFFYNKRNV